MHTLLHNAGKRVIQLDVNGVHLDFKPGTTVEFPDEKAAYLKRLFPMELQGRADVLTPFSQADDNAKANAEAALEKREADKTDPEKIDTDALKAKQEEAYQSAITEGFSEAEARELAKDVTL